jgi:membrane fusion protein (multidrug efflux system)
MSIPRAAILTDQRGDYVYVVDSENKAQARRVRLGPSTPGVVAVTNGLNEGDRVVVDGIQRIRPNQAVSPQTAGSAERAPGPSTPG